MPQTEHIPFTNTQLPHLRLSELNIKPSPQLIFIPLYDCNDIAHYHHMKQRYQQEKLVSGCKCGINLENSYRTIETALRSAISITYRQSHFSSARIDHAL